MMEKDPQNIGITRIKSPILKYNRVFLDDRGTFAPLSLIYGENRWIQSNISVNPKRLTFRGLHYQNEPYAQSKLVKVINGEIIDFIVDLKENVGDVHIFKMISGYELYVPKGFAHGFITCKDNTIVQYLVDEPYNPLNEGSILWSSVPIIYNEIISNFDDIENIIISDKDYKAQNFDSYVKK